MCACVHVSMCDMCACVHVCMCDMCAYVHKYTKEEAEDGVHTIIISRVTLGEPHFATRVDRRNDSLPLLLALPTA